MTTYQHSPSASIQHNNSIWDSERVAKSAKFRLKSMYLRSSSTAESLCKVIHSVPFIARALLVCYLLQVLWIVLAAVVWSTLSEGLSKGKSLVPFPKLAKFLSEHFRGVTRNNARSLSDRDLRTLEGCVAEEGFVSESRFMDFWRWFQVEFLFCRFLWLANRLLDW